jgi:hypothetical protein
LIEAESSGSSEQIVLRSFAPIQSKKQTDQSKRFEEEKEVTLLNVE